MITVGFRVVRIEESGRAANLSRIYHARAAAEDFLKIFQHHNPHASACVVAVQRREDRA